MDSKENKNFTAGTVQHKYLQFREKERIIQRLLKDQRQWVIHRFSYILPKRYTENRYRKTEHRNKYEVDRIWDEKLEFTIKVIEEQFYEFPFLRQISHYILASRYHQLVNFRRIRCEVLEDIIKNHFLGRTMRYQLEDAAADSRLEREHEFCTLLFELLDRAENVENEVEK